MGHFVIWSYFGVGWGGVDIVWFIRGVYICYTTFTQCVRNARDALHILHMASISCLFISIVERISESTI